MPYNAMKKACVLCGQKLIVSHPVYKVTERYFNELAKERGWSIAPLLCPLCRRELNDE